ncbi:MAG TPA: DUF4402 domain-containing protein [Bacteroidales bacterium]
MSITAQVFAEVISSNTATEVAQLNFGKFSPGISGGKIIISPQGILTSAGTVVPGASQHNAGTFNISGDAAGTFVVTLPDEPVILTEISGSKTMQVIDWVSDPPSGSNITLVEGGTQTVYVGATLVVGNIIDNPSGLYSGTYSITFDYN